MAAIEILRRRAPSAVNASSEGTSESREMYDTSGNSIGPYSKSHGMHAWACVAVRELVLEGLVTGLGTRRTAHREGPVTKDRSGAQDEQHGGIWVIRRWVGETWGGRQGDVAYLPGQVRRPCGCTRLGKGMRVRRIEAGLAREIRSGVPRWAACDTQIGQRGTAGQVVQRLHHRGTQES